MNVYFGVCVLRARFHIRAQCAQNAARLWIRPAGRQDHEPDYQDCGRQGEPVHSMGQAASRRARVAREGADKQLGKQNFAQIRDDSPETSIGGGGPERNGQRTLSDSLYTCPAGSASSATNTDRGPIATSCSPTHCTSPLADDGECGSGYSESTLGQSECHKVALRNTQAPTLASKWRQPSRQWPPTSEAPDLDRRQISSRTCAINLVTSHEDRTRHDRRSDKTCKLCRSALDCPANGLFVSSGCSCIGAQSMQQQRRQAHPSTAATCPCSCSVLTIEPQRSATGIRSTPAAKRTGPTRASGDEWRQQRQRERRNKRHLLSSPAFSQHLGAFDRSIGDSLEAAAKGHQQQGAAAFKSGGSATRSRGSASSSEKVAEDGTEKRLPLAFVATGAAAGGETKEVFGDGAAGKGSASEDQLNGRQDETDEIFVASQPLARCVKQNTESAEKSAGSKQQHTTTQPDTFSTSQYLCDQLSRPQQAINNHHSPSKTTNYLDWNEISLRFGKMSRRDQRLTGRSSCWYHSCFCHLMATLLRYLFPIFTSFKGYSFTSDLFADFVAGITIAIIQIPQGMAYGLLAGVEPVHGLYVSFVPVLVIAFMSKSRHVSYGTFAIISMLLMNTIDSVRQTLKQQYHPQLANTRQHNYATPEAPDALVLTNNHQPMEPAQQLLKNLLQTSASEPVLTNFISTPPIATNKQQLDAQLVLANDTLSQMAATILGQQQLDPAIVFITPTNIEILTCVCLLCGLIHITMSLMRLGVLSLMFSDQLVSSFTTASAIHVITSQLCGLLDLKIAPIQGETFKIFKIWWQFIKTLISALHQSQDEPASFNQLTALLSLASIVFLLAIKEVVEPLLRRRFKSLTCLPSELALMIVVTFSSWYWQFKANYNIRIVGRVPTGMPAPYTPRLDLVPLVLQDSLTIALVSFAMNFSLAQVYARKYRYKLDSNQELLALGTANVVSSFFSCFPCASSLSRSAIQSDLNVKSQLCSIFGCAIVITIVCWCTSILHDLPRSTLSCIIVVALKGILVQFRDLYENWRLSKLDALVWLTTFVSVIVFGVAFGLIIGIITSLSMIFFRLLTPNHSILGRLPGTEIYVDLDAFAHCKEVEQVKIFRFNSALCYLNRTMLKSRIEKSLSSIYRPQGFHQVCARLHHHHHQPGGGGDTSSYSNGNNSSGETDCDHSRVKFLIIDCSALAYCDCAGVATLIEIIDELEEHKVDVFLASCPLKLIDIIEKMGQRRILERNVYPTITDAIGQVKCVRNLGAKSDSSESTRPSESCCWQPTVIDVT